MDNDLMARRLRPPSQPTPSNGQSPAQPPAPWDVPLVDEGSFAPAEPAHPQQDTPFAPPDPAARADVPWDRPAPESWPPGDDWGSDYPQTWSGQAGPPESQPAQPVLPADPLGDAAPPWDRPASDHSLDPDDALAPVVADVNAPARVWHEWMSSGGAHGADGGKGTGYATASTPEPMTVAAQSDQPRGGDEPRPDAWVDAFDTTTAGPGAASTGSGPSLPEWPAEDDLTPPSSSLPDSTPPAPEETPAPASAVEPSGVQPLAPLPSLTPVVTSAQIVPSPPGSPQNMVLRIELAIVDESRANPAAAADRVGPEAEVRAREYNPRTDVGRAPIPEPEYIWDVPPADVRGQVAPPSMAWPPAPAQPTPHTNQQALWPMPPQRDPQTPPPVAPPPTWALTEPTQPDTPEPPQYSPPSAPQHQRPAPYQPAPQPAWPPSPSSDPLSGLPAAPSAAADQAGPWFLSGQAEVVTAADDDAQPMGKSSAVVTAGLTVGFALLVIVLVLVFIQLMTSLLR